MEYDLDDERWQDYLEVGEGSGLKIGSGTQEEITWDTMDIRDLPPVDVCHDILEIPWPIEDDSYDRVFAEDVLEHLPSRNSYMTTTPPDNQEWFQVEYIDGDRTFVSYKIDCLVPVMEEIYRILKPGGYFLLQAPSPGGDFELADPTHVRRVHPEMFNHWDPTHEHYGMSFDTTAKFDIEWVDKSSGNFLMALRKIQ